MIRGAVRAKADDGTGLEAWIDIAIAGDDRELRTMAAVVDTGATDWLTLPEPVVQGLGLRLTSTRHVRQAHGPIVQANVYAVWVLWHGRMRRVFAESGNETLIGTELLADSRLIVQWREGGEVIIEERSRPGQ